MFFVQSRIGMNDVYVGLFIIAAYTLFAAVWTGWWRGRAAFWLAMPVIGVLLGLALASKWVAAYAIGALVLLLLVRSALGRVLAILGLIGITTVLGYLAISRPGGPGLRQPDVPADHDRPDPDRGRRRHPPPGRLDRRGDADRRRRRRSRSGALVFFVAVAAGRSARPIALGPIAVTPLQIALRCSRSGSIVVAGLFWLGGRDRLRAACRRRPRPDDPARLLEPPAPAPDGWLRPGWLLGLPMSVRRSASSPAARRVRRLVHPMGADREPPAVAGWPAGPHRPDAARADRRRCTTTTTA